MTRRYTCSACGCVGHPKSTCKAPSSRRTLSLPRCRGCGYPTDLGQEFCSPHCRERLHGPTDGSVTTSSDV